MFKKLIIEIEEKFYKALDEQKIENAEEVKKLYEKISNDVFLDSFLSHAPKSDTSDR